MMSDLLLNEIERQKKYLAELPETFNFPLFNTKRALESQRQNGYKNTAVAAREIVDNAMEAKASKVHVIFDTRQNNTREAVSFRCLHRRRLGNDPSYGAVLAELGWWDALR